MYCWVSESLVQGLEGNSAILDSVLQAEMCEYSIKSLFTGIIFIEMLLIGSLNFL